MAVFRRKAAVDDVEFSSSLRQRFSFLHPELSAEARQTVEAGARQWLRLQVRQPRARLTMPSVIVGDFIRQLVLQNQGTEPSIAERSRLGATFQLARRDEPDTLPLLFRIDRELNIPGGWNYLADCGGRGVCYELKDMICLQHLKGPGKRTGGGTWSSRGAGAGADGSMSGNGCGTGCGGGCGGGN